MGQRDGHGFIASQRDTYKYVHDQALRYANKGYTPLEAAEEIELPDELGRKWFNRGYHGTLHHDVRAVYTKELGMWDGDPVSLHPHPPVESAKRFVALVGSDTILDEGRRAIEAADYRWAAEILHKLVFAEPDNPDAKHLQADAYEQLGYQAEGPQWRGIYLSAAKELREGAAVVPFATASPDTILAMPIDILFDFVAVHIKGPEAADVDLSDELVFADHDETWNLWVRRGVLNARRGARRRRSAHDLRPQGGPGRGVCCSPAPARSSRSRGRSRWTATSRCSTASAGSSTNSTRTSTSSLRRDVRQSMPTTPQQLTFRSPRRSRRTAPTPRS